MSIRTLKNSETLGSSPYAPVLPVFDVKHFGALCDGNARASGGAITGGLTAFTGSGFAATDVNKTIAIAGAGTANVATTTADVTFPQATIALSSVADTRLNTAGGMVVVGGHPVIYQGITGLTLTGCSGGVSGVTVASGAAVTCPGPAGFVTTIAAYVSPTQVTLTDAPPVTVTSAPYWTYTDDSAAVQAAADYARLHPGTQIVLGSGVCVVKFQSHPQNAAYKTCVALASRFTILTGATLMLAPFQPATNSANCTVITNYDIAGSAPYDVGVAVDGGGVIEGNALYQQANFYSGVTTLRCFVPRFNGVTVKNMRGLTQSSGLLSGGETVFFSSDLCAGPRWTDCLAICDQGITVPGVIIGGNSGKLTAASNIFITTAAAYPAGFSAADIGKWVHFNTPGLGTFLSAVITSIDSATQCRLSVNSPSTVTASNWAMGALCASGFSANISTGPKWVDCIAIGMTVSNNFTHNTCRGVEYVGCSQWLAWNQGFNSEVTPEPIYTGCHSGGRAATGSDNHPFSDGQYLGACIGNGYAFVGSTNAVLNGCDATFNGSAGAGTSSAGSATVNGGYYANNNQQQLTQGAGSTLRIMGRPVVDNTGGVAAVATSGWSSDVYPGVPANGDGAGHSFPQPAGSGVAVVNPWPCDVLVSMTGGVASGAAIAAASGGSLTVDPDAAVRVPPGGSYTPTYSGTAPVLAGMLV